MSHEHYESFGEIKSPLKGSGDPCQAYVTMTSFLAPLKGGLGSFFLGTRGVVFAYVSLQGNLVNKITIFISIMSIGQLRPHCPNV